MARRNAGTLLLVDNDADTLTEIGTYLEAKDFEVDYARDGLAGYQLATGHVYDAIVHELALPRLAGWELCQRLRQTKNKDASIVVLATSKDVHDKVRLLEMGADDYLCKPFDVRELEARVTSMVKRARRQVPGSVLRFADIELHIDGMWATRAGRKLRVPPLGCRILQILMREAPRLVYREDIEREIWGDDPPDSDCLRNHIFALRKAIDRDFGTALLQTIPTFGYRLNKG